MTTSKVPVHPSNPGGSIRILTHNIYATHSQWLQRRRVLIDGLRDLRPDLIVLQETMVTDEYDQAADILDEEFTIVHSAERESGGQGISIASRWPITSVNELNLNVTPRTGDFACTTLIAEVEAHEPIGPLLLVNHFPDWQLDHEHERELQAVVVAEWIETYLADHNKHVLLAGDFDADPDAASVRFFSGKQSLHGTSVSYRRAWESIHPECHTATFTVENPLVREANWDWPYSQIDHIFVRCGRHGGPTLGIASCELAFNTPVDGVWASDHFAVVADLVAVDGRAASVLPNCCGG